MPRDISFSKRSAHEEVILEQWAENEDRRELSDYEKALKLKQMLDAFKMTQEELADKLGKSRTWVTNHLRLLSLEKFMSRDILSRLSEFRFFEKASELSRA